MIVNTILFDLDGTLRDPKLGVTRCIQYALSELGYIPPETEQLYWCIGPPIKDSFSQLLTAVFMYLNHIYRRGTALLCPYRVVYLPENCCKTSDNPLVEKAVSLYRSRFSTIGLFENSLYPLITETLKAIRVAGYKTFVATSKPHIYATRIIEYFSLSLLFDDVYGSEFDGTRSAKADLISHILLTENLSPSSVVMLGDNFVKLR